MFKNKQDAQAGWRDRFKNRTVRAKPEHKVTVKALSSDSAEILLYGEIGYWGITAADFSGILAGIDAKSITVRVNSPGGDVFDGLAIYNLLKAHPAKITTVVDGLAASAASFIMLAGDTVSAAKNSLIMIHKAWAVGVGNSDDMTAMAGVLEKIDNQIAGMYADKNGKSVKENLDAMAKETWMTAEEAEEFGLIDTVSGETAEEDPEEPDEDDKPENKARVSQMRMRLALSSID